MVYQGSPLGDGDPEWAAALDGLALGDDAGVGDPGDVAFGFLVNHTVPSGEAAMPEGPVFVTGKSVTELLDGLRRPTAWGVNRAVNQTCPSEATVMLARGHRGGTVGGRGRRDGPGGRVDTADVAGAGRVDVTWLGEPGVAGHVHGTSAGSETGNDVNCPFEIW